MNMHPDTYIEAERVDVAERLAARCSHSVDSTIAVVTGMRGGEYGVHTITGHVEPDETLHSIWLHGECLLRRVKA
jgi:hypothetical protein